MPDPKLTATQQEVVNLMAAGWTLCIRIFNGSGSSWLERRGTLRKVRIDMADQLERRGLVVKRNSLWHERDGATRYGLTTKALAAFNAKEGR